MSNKTTTKPAVTKVISTTDMPIFLVGMMGVGKTTIGRQLAISLNRKFIDLDHAIEDRSGVPVATIFDIEGEQGFRKRESAALDEFTQQAGLVLATGGGAILAPKNRHMLSKRGYVIYLRASTEVLFKRLARDSKRPLLQTGDPKQKIRDLIKERGPLYASVADLTFDTADKQVSTVVGDLLAVLKANSIYR